MLSYYALSGLINAIASTVLGLLVYFRDRKNSLNRSFALFCFSVALWSWAYIFWPGAQTKASALLAFQALHVGAILVPIAYFRFTIIFLNLYNEKNKQRILKVGYFLVLFFWLFVFTPLYIKDMVPKFSFRFWAEPGILYHFFLLMFFGYASYCWYLLFVNYKKSTGAIRQQIKYVLIGTVIGFLGGSTNYFLWYNIPISPWGNGLVAVYVILIAVAVLRYHLFEIRVVLTELLVGVIALILLIQGVTATTFGGKIFGFFLLFLFGIAAYFLIKSVLKEIQQREELKIAKERAEKAYEVEKKSHEELKKLDEAKSQFVLITQHHLRTPLSIMKGYVSMLLEGSYGKMNEEFIKPLKGFQISTDNLIKLVNEFLDISQLQVGSQILSPQEAQIEDLIQEIIQELKPEADKKRIYLEIEKPTEPLPKVNIDRAKVKAALFNVIDNGMKYTPSGGVKVRFKTTDSKLKIIIQDTGIGMTKEDIDTLFTRFFSRGKEAKKVFATGRGIGLYMAERIIKAHQGRVWAESPGKDKGSTFYIELPIKL